jgi:hypothetical protein
MTEAKAVLSTIFGTTNDTFEINDRIVGSPAMWKTCMEISGLRLASK